MSRFVPRAIVSRRCVRLRTATTPIVPATLRNRAGVAYVNCGESDKALEQFETAWRMNPQDPKAFTFTGTRAELAEGLRAVKTAGLSQFGMHIRTGHELEMLENWADVIAKV